MADLWIDGYAKQPLPPRLGGTYDRTSNKKVLLHTTEGTSVLGAVRAYQKYPPHLIVHPETDERVQHIPLNRSAYSLKGSESDDEPVIQVEIVGRAAQAPDWTDNRLQWLAVHVLAPIHRLWPYTLQVPPQGFHGPNDGIKPYIATAQSPIRFTNAAFEAFSGICGHQHAPNPDTHWDPGKVNARRLLYLLGTELNPPPIDTSTAEVLAVNERLSQLEERFAVVNEILGSAVSANDLVESLYRIVLDRDPDHDGLAHWVQLLAENKISPVALIDSFMQARGTDKQ